MHATGRYPEDWKGKRFDGPTVGWVAGTTNETTRDTVQRILLGRDSERGTGCLPKECILDLVQARGIPDLLDNVKVRHVSGGISTIAIKSYQRGRESFQGETLDYIWLDEECPIDIYLECLTRTNVKQGPLWMTYTPILGMSETTRRFLLDKSPDRHVTVMTIDDVGHFTQEEREKIIASYPPHEREARTKGIPTLGSGRVFPVTDEQISCKRMPIPSHWPRIGGLDFGYHHPSAAVEVAWDRDHDVAYVIRAHRMTEATPITMAAAIRPWGATLPWAWPRDGKRETQGGAGLALAQQFRHQGLNMLPLHAQFVEDKSVSLEAGLMMMLDRMETGRLKIFSELRDLFEEISLYHRKDGRVVKEREDTICAVRYALMMLRFAETNERKASYRAFPRPKMGGNSWLAN